MKILISIIHNNIIPLLILVFVGYLINKKFNLNIYSLSKLNLYVFAPVFVFVNLYTTQITMEMIKVIVFMIVFLIVNFIIITLIMKKMKYDRGTVCALKNSVMFYNSGNIGIPLITFVFSNPPFLIDGQTPFLSIALTTQVIILVIQNTSANTIGFFNANYANMNWRVSLKKILRIPTVYMIFLALGFKLISYDLTQESMWASLSYIKEGFVAFSLITLGVQLSKIKLDIQNSKVYSAVFLRLVGGPIIALLLLLLLNIKGVMAQTILISSGLPTALNTALIAIECKNRPKFASQVVMVATLLSCVTLTTIIYLARIIFPI